ncbi:hypothetical protein ILYODFUR_022611 [Ilyodon furcidens]|uniref:Uncharacterized protein n=1 Tax=Ilyodon furcidens TaxID=33524 RepID=A0ABV0V5A6_9TELE
MLSKNPVFLCVFQIFTRYGKCYTFNSGQDGRPLLVTMKGGTGNGLELMLDIQQDEYLPVWGETEGLRCAGRTRSAREMANESGDPGGPLLGIHQERPWSK